MKYGDRLAPTRIASELAAKCELLRDAFPGHAIETVLVLGKRPRNIDSTLRHFDHVLTAEEVFLEPAPQ